jgi:hypothetical protein
VIIDTQLCVEGENCKESMTLREAITENIKLFITLLLKLRYIIFNILQCATKVPKCGS